MSFSFLIQFLDLCHISHYFNVTLDKNDMTMACIIQHILFLCETCGHPALFTSHVSKYPGGCLCSPAFSHTFCPFWQSTRSLELDGCIAEKVVPKLPLSLDSRLSLLPSSHFFFYHSLPDHPLPPLHPLSAIYLSYASSPPPTSLSLLATLSFLLSLLCSVIPCVFYCWIMSSTHLDAPVDRRLSPSPLMTLHSMASQRWISGLLIPKKRVQQCIRNKSSTSLFFLVVERALSLQEILEIMMQK